MPEQDPPAECANCGATIPRRALACPECGADERTGWREQSMYDGLDLPEPGQGEDGPPKDPFSNLHVNGLPWYWYIVAAFLLAAAVLFVLRLR